MKFFRRDERGVVLASAAVITLLSIVLGGGAAAAAVFTILSLQGPDDSAAVQTGHQDLVDPASVIPYGG
jgi:hypothetical protein